MRNALVCIDFINEIVGPSGKLAGKGYLDFVTRHNTLANLAKEQVAVREAGGHVIHVHLGFTEDYSDHPKGSPLLGGARGAGILQRNTPSTEIVKDVAPREGDIVLVKTRISAFYRTDLERSLLDLGVQRVLLAGVATDLAVESAARDAHDRDFEVEVLASCCAAASDSDHAGALAVLRKIAAVRE
jgi:nicotinamidase-related amidase